MQKKPTKRSTHARNVRRRLGQLERLESRRLMTVVPPLVENDLYHAPADQSLSIEAAGVLSNDTGTGTAELSAHLFSGPEHGSLTLETDGSFLYVPNSGYVGLDSFMYWASEGDAASLLAAVTLRVSTDSGGPQTLGDAYAVNEDDILSIPAPAGVLDNDAAMAGFPLTAELLTGPEHGSLTFGEDGSFTYVPNANYHGSDTFTYIAHEGNTSSAPTSVTLTVRPVNDKPVATNDSFSIPEDSTLTVDTTSVLANDTDLDNDPLVANLVSAPLHGTVTLNEDGTFTYTPSADFNGIDGFSYLASDGTNDSQVATVTINVGSLNDAPVANNDEYSLDEDSTLTVEASGVLGNDTDIDSSPLTTVLVSGPQNGTLALNEDGSFTYTPAANFSGVDGFSYLVTDGVDQSAVATVTLNVNDTNDAPVANNDEYALDEDSTLTVEASGVLGNDTDGDGDSLVAALVNGPQNGTLTLNGDGSFSYTPNADFSGVDGFSYLVNDGTSDSAVATVTLNVTSVNDTPVANSDEFTLDEDTTLAVEANGVLGNDTDGDGDSLAATLVSGPQNGSLILNSDGSFTYTPSADFSGADEFSYLVNDGASDSAVATVTLNVTSTNDMPVATDDGYSMEEDGVLTVDATGVLANDTDIDGDALTPTLIDGPQNGSLTMNSDGSFVYTPSADFHGTDTFTYSVNDGAAESEVATVTITVAPVNDAPTAIGEEYAMDEDSVLTIEATGVLANDTDPEGDALTAVLATGPQHGSLTLNSDGSFVYTPNANYFGSDSFTYKSSDGSSESQEVAVSIVVNPTPDAPITNGDSYSSGEDSPVSGTVLGNDFDPEGLTLSAELVTGPANGTLELSSDGAFTYTPNANFFGSDTFTYMASNSVESSGPTTVTFHIDPINDAPTAAGQAYSVATGGTLTVDASEGLLADADDIEGDSLSLRLLYEPQHGTLVMSDDGSFGYTPDEGFVGNDRFFYQVNDGRADSTVVEVVITVGGTVGETPNTAPAGQADGYVVVSGQSLTIDAPGVLANDIDADADPLTANLVSGPSHGALQLAEDGSLTYTPEAGFVGEDSFTYTAHDGEASSDPITVTLTVNELSSENVAPTSADDQFSTGVDTPLNIPTAGVLGNDSDANGDALSATLVDGPLHGTLALAADGSFAYTPNAGYSGTDTFTYTATDGALLGNTATVTITIATTENTRPNAVNDQYQTGADSPLVIGDTGVLGNDSDAQNDALTAHLFSGPQHGTVTLASDGSFAYTPEAGFTGVDSFIYRSFDGQRYSALAAVTIRVNAAAPSSLMLDTVAAGQGDEDGWLSDTVDALFSSEDPLA